MKMLCNLRLSFLVFVGFFAFAIPTFAQNVVQSSAAPTVTAITPSIGVAGSSLNITITGTDFADPVSLLVSNGGITGTFTVNSATSITASINIALTMGPGPYYFTVASNGIGSNPVLFTVIPGPPRLDFNVDKKADLLWYNAATGQTASWLMNGLNPTDPSNVVLLADPNFKVIAAPDLNGDGKTDLIWYNAATGETLAWLMSWYLHTSSATLLTDPNWKITGTPDFNGDGKSDLLWYNAATGETASWLMDGLSILNSNYRLLLTDPYWKVTGTPDFNGDGKADLLWYNAATGETAVWLMDGVHILGSNYVQGSNFALLRTDPNWKVTDTPDFNGDGKADLLWYNAATGETEGWLINGLNSLSSTTLLTDPNWKVVDTLDFNGDGKKDLLWYNATTGQTAGWLMDGLSNSSISVLFSDPNWKTIQPGK